MKKLMLVRHAKSDWGNEALKDIDRPLASRGYEDAYFMSKWFKETYPIPDQLISSAASRALNTALIFAREFNIRESSVKIEEKIYETNVDVWLKIISQFDNRFNSIMLFGHNPVMTNLANELNTELLFDNAPTCSVISLGLDIKEWKEILSKKEGKLLNYKFPKSFKQ